MLSNTEGHRGRINVASEELPSGNLEGLIERISVCLKEADAAGQHIAAAHLDQALVALRGYGIEPDYGAEGETRQTH
jgi:hypothetical protein